MVLTKSIALGYIGISAEKYVELLGLSEKGAKMRSVQKLVKCEWIFFSFFYLVFLTEIIVSITVNFSQYNIGVVKVVLPNLLPHGG